MKKIKNNKTLYTPAGRLPTSTPLYNIIIDLAFLFINKGFYMFIYFILYKVLSHLAPLATKEVLIIFSIIIFFPFKPLLNRIFFLINNNYKEGKSLLFRLKENIGYGYSLNGRLYSILVILVSAIWGSTAG